jgi:hypothetical protein
VSSSCAVSDCIEAGDLDAADRRDGLAGLVVSNIGPSCPLQP